MKIALGLVGILISMIVMFQSFAIYGLSGLVNEEATAQAGALGLFSGFLLFVAGALSFGLLRAAAVVYLIAGFLAHLGKADFPDLGVWAWVAFILCTVCGVTDRSQRKAKSGESQSEQV